MRQKKTERPAFVKRDSIVSGKEFPGQTGFSVTNIKYAKRWYEFYNQEDIIHHQAGDEFLHQLGEEFEMPVDFGRVPWKHHIHIFTHSQSISEALFFIDEIIKNERHSYRNLREN